MSFYFEEKSSLPVEQDHNSLPDSFYEGHDPITQVRRARLLTVLETSTEFVITYWSERTEPSRGPYSPHRLLSVSFVLDVVEIFV